MGSAAKNMQVVTLGGKEVNRYKWNKDGSLDKRKTRYAARGDTQDMDSYGETFSPAPQIRSMRLILLLSTIYDLTVYHFDVTAAFLNSPLQFDIWMRLPEGFTQFGNFKYAKLLKSIYGLKQAARDWFDLQEQFVQNYDKRFVKSEVEPCLYYILDWESGLKVMILVQVDDTVGNRSRVRGMQRRRQGWIELEVSAGRTTGGSEDWRCLEDS